MELTWVVAAIVGCVALAACIALVLLRPMDAERRQLRPLANVGRLTTLPEYVRAKRARTRDAVVTIALLVVMFACAVVVAARPTGLPTSARQSDGGDPEDIMLCVGAPVSDQAVGDDAELLRRPGGRLRYPAHRVDLAQPPGGAVDQGLPVREGRLCEARPRSADVGAFSPAVSYVDYSESLDDQLALCLTGFPAFDRQAAQRRSVIYVGPGELRSPGDRRPALFTADQVSGPGARRRRPGQRARRRAAITLADGARP